MFDALFWILLRSVAIPYVAFLILRDTPLQEQGALLAIGIALLIVTLISLFWNFLKIIGNTLLLRGNAILILLLKIIIQVFALLFLWGYYFAEYTDVLKY